ncbi:Adenylyl-sulfate kinase [Psidium guajava]|nr:Adenylyl-sulfate kinase [Psidium guajava]
MNGQRKMFSGQQKKPSKTKENDFLFLRNGNHFPHLLLPFLFSSVTRTLRPCPSPFQFQPNTGKGSHFPGK